MIEVSREQGFGPDQVEKSRDGSGWCPFLRRPEIVRKLPRADAFPEGYAIAAGDGSPKHNNHLPVKQCGKCRCAGDGDETAGSAQAGSERAGMYAVYPLANTVQSRRTTDLYRIRNMAARHRVDPEHKVTVNRCGGGERGDHALYQVTAGPSFAADRKARIVRHLQGDKVIAAGKLP